MNKPRLLYFSPIPPHKSGIADYSAVMLKHLSKFFAITLCIDLNSPADKSKTETPKHDFEVIVFGRDLIRTKDFDYLVYNLGNNASYHSYMYDFLLKNPGIVILHDLVLYYLVVGMLWKGSKIRFFWRLFRIGGMAALGRVLGLLAQTRHPLYCPFEKALPLNKEVLLSANKFVVHSQFVRRQILDKYPGLSERIQVLPMIEQEYEGPLIDRAVLLKKYSVPSQHLILASFGFIAPTKLNHLICEAVLRLRREGYPLVYIMVGEGPYVDSYVDNTAIFRTNYISLSEFESFIHASDIVLNLRKPSMGESSASLMRILFAGKACLVSDDAWFSELPDNVVMKIDNQRAEAEIYDKLRILAENANLRENLGQEARLYAQKNHQAGTVAEKLANFILTS